MRLLNTSSGLLKEEFEEDLPQYAILSHRWGPLTEEVSFVEYTQGLKTDTSGYQKIQRFLETAARDGISWAWIDTCCIDKTSSAELSEAINSMFSWYRNAAKCYAFLGDVREGCTWEESRWWTRGWTLQELIAPADVVFYDHDWQCIGAKFQLAGEISDITGVPTEVLKGEQPLTDWTVAQRFCWAAGRQTKRVEDRAYSLLGLFSINMPLLYGEGSKAFQRLQLEILQKIPDESVFAWKGEIDPHGTQHVLAESPDRFEACSYMQPVLQRGYEPLWFSPPRVTSWGIELKGCDHRLWRKDLYSTSKSWESSVSALNTTVAWRGQCRELPCLILLAPSNPTQNSYRRVGCLHLFWEDAEPLLRQTCMLSTFNKNQTFYLQFDADLAL